MNDNFALVDERLHWWWYSRWMSWLRDRSLAAADVNIGESIHKTAEPTKTQRCTHNVVQVGRIKLLCAWFFHMPVYSHFVARALLSCLFWCPIGRILILNRLPLFLLWNDIYHNKPPQNERLGRFYQTEGVGEKKLNQDGLGLAQNEFSYYWKRNM